MLQKYSRYKILQEFFDFPRQDFQMREIARRTKFIAPRDYSSALEIRRLCLQKIGHELPESTLVEMEALPLLRKLPSLKQEAPCES